MPLLSSDELVWEIGYRHANEHWYYYRMKLLWRGLPVINSAVRNPNEDGSPRDEIGMCHSDCDGLRHIIDYALNSGRPVAWDSIEPDTRLAVYPAQLGHSATIQVSIFTIRAAPATRARSASKID